MKNLTAIQRLFLRRIILPLVILTASAHAIIDLFVADNVIISTLYITAILFLITLFLLNKVIIHPLSLYEQTLSRQESDQDAIDDDNDYGALNDILSRSQKLYQYKKQTIKDVYASLARLIPMSSELQDTYSALTQKTSMQQHYSDQLANAITAVVESANIVLTNEDEINALISTAVEDLTRASNHSQHQFELNQTLAKRVADASSEIT